MVSRIITSAALLLATTSFASVASAGCNNGGTYCSSSNSYVAPLGTWTANSGAYDYEGSQGSLSSSGYSSVTMPGTFSPAASYSSTSYGGMMSDAQASASYGSGSISQTYTGGDVQMYGFSGATNSVAGLGAGEYLQSTNCPGAIHNPEGGRVLGCYNVVRQERRTNYVRVVRPVIYVRYPVPTPIYSPCYSYQYHHTSYNHGGGSRYGNWGPMGANMGGGARGGCR